MSWLLTGGAGYIGSHVLRAVRTAGLDVVVIDDLSTGDARRVPAGVPFVEASVLDGEALRRVMHEHGVTGVIHLASKKSVEESMDDPLLYYRENVVGALTVLQAMAATGVRQMVFSSSAAVYGTPPGDSVDESSPTLPESPYGRTKLVNEWMVRDAARALGFSCVSLRYFNVTGAAGAALADVDGVNLFPRVMRALTAGEQPQLFGRDHPTRDGSCIRDYVHVQDLAEAHVAAARLVSSTTCDETINIGCGTGHTVLEVLAAVGEVTGLDASPRVLAKRAGDPPGVVAEVGKAARVLNWTARLGLRDMVRSAWEAMEQAPAVRRVPAPGRALGPFSRAS
jgi:UDP-glucose 4-epimerase